MKNTLRLNHETRSIVMDKTFAKFAADTKSAEYAHLQRVRQDYPTYTVEQRHIKKNSTKECYLGLTYEYMKKYILTYGDEDDVRTFNEMRFISQCHSKAFRYPVIKAWFLKRFPEVKQFGVKEITDNQASDVKDEPNRETASNITELPKVS